MRSRSRWPAADAIPQHALFPLETSLGLCYRRLDLTRADLRLRGDVTVTCAEAPLTGSVFLIVLGAALLHAVWNAIVKGAGDQRTTLGLIGLGHVIPGVVLVFWLPLPDSSVWVLIAFSTFLHWGYFHLLNLSYRLGDLSVVYPIARGYAPVLTALGAAFWVGEYLPPLAWVGIAGVSGGILFLAIGQASRASAPALGAAALTAFSVAAYSIVDGIGARQAGGTLSYIAWLFVAESVIVLHFLFPRLRARAMIPARQFWAGLAGGLISGLAYALVIYAMTLAPLGVVSAVRETSVIFAAMIGIFFLGEGPAGRRIIAAVIVAAGVIGLALA